MNTRGIGKRGGGVNVCVGGGGKGYICPRRKISAIRTFM